ncbi:histidine phosphatase family protein [Paenibacillus sp. YSY-4.3]
MKRIYLIRHCKADGQEPDAQLTSEGQLQADQLAALFIAKQIDYIISSSYERAVSTIRPLAEALNMTIHMDNRLCERVLSAEEIDDWMEKLKESFEDLDMKLSGGESSREAMMRGISVIEEIIDRPEMNIVVVTHGNLLSLILKYYDNDIGFNDWSRLSNPDVFELDLNREETRRITRIWT